MASYEESWRILDGHSSYSFCDYLIAARAAASSENGVIGIRLMYESLSEVIVVLRKLYDATANSDLALLKRIFGNLKFIYLCRDDVAAQAISLYRAEQTGHWHTVEGEAPERDPAFDFDAIHTLMNDIKQQSLAWDKFKNWC